MRNQLEYVMHSEEIHCRRLEEGDQLAAGTVEYVQHRKAQTVVRLTDGRKLYFRAGETIWIYFDNRG